MNLARYLGNSKMFYAQYAMQVLINHVLTKEKKL